MTFRDIHPLALTPLYVFILCFAVAGLSRIVCNKGHHAHNFRCSNYISDENTNNFSKHSDNKPLLYWRTDINNDGRKDSIVENWMEIITLFILSKKWEI